MPQMFQVLRCYKCSVFQVHQTKKSIKFECKLCGEKQSIKRHYGLGTGKECRLHVQKLNGIRADIDHLKETETSDNSDEVECEVSTTTMDTINTVKESKWKSFIDHTYVDKVTESENVENYLGDVEVVLEPPLKKKKKRFITPKSVNNSLNLYNNVIEDEVENLCYFKTNDTIKAGKDLEHVTNFPRTFPMAEVATNDYNCDKSDKKVIDFNCVSQLQKHQVNNNNSLKAYKPVQVKGSSKWAEYVSEPDDNDTQTSIDEDQLLEDKSSLNKNDLVVNKSKNLFAFALCSDNEIDDVLDF